MFTLKTVPIVLARELLGSQQFNKLTFKSSQFKIDKLGLYNENLGTHIYIDEPT